MSIPKFRSVVLPETIPGKLLLHSMPGRYESWSEFESSAETAQICGIVALTPRAEIREKSPDYDAAVEFGSPAWRWWNIPIPDFGIPGDFEDFRRHVREIADQLRNGRTILIHCGAGIGRTGTFAICVLLELGLSLAAAREEVRLAEAGPERDPQLNLIRQYAAQME